MSLKSLSASIVLLLCLGGANGWAQQDDQKQQPADQQQQQADRKPQQDQKQQDPKRKEQQQKDRRQMRGLDEEVQDVKSDVLRISAELRQLEEKLLYPSGTQVAVFVALAKGDQMRLDSVRLRIDGQMVAQYVYSAKELEALRKGGVQRLYVGNVATGDHQIDVSVDGKRNGGEDFSHSEKLSFRKEVKPKLLELTLAGPDSGSKPVALGEL